MGLKHASFGWFLDENGCGASLSTSKLLRLELES